MNFCSRCIMPDTRPDLALDRYGICSACRSVEQKKSINWLERRKKWLGLVQWAQEERHKRGNAYDCIAAVSGGKDSHYIVITCLRNGLNPLCVSFEPSLMSPLGQQNLENLQRYCDLIQIKKNKTTYQKLRQIGLRQLGDSEWPNHVGIFTSVTREAVARNIPLIIWGENPQAEYAPPDERSISNEELNRAWLEEFGGLLGMRISDVISQGFAASDLSPYTWPSQKDISRVGLRSRFLGHYFPWDTTRQAEAILDWGFVWAKQPAHGSYWPFENLDDPEAVAFHDFLGLCKYGYTRAMVQLSVEIRHGTMDRDRAIELALQIGDSYPEADEERFCDSIGLSADEVRKICISYLNSAIWDKNANGQFYRKKGAEIR